MGEAFRQMLSTFIYVPPEVSYTACSIVESVTCIKSLLQNLAPEIEEQVKSALRGFLTRWVVSGNLPQTWVFQTEDETVTFNVDTNGNVSVLQVHPPVSM